MNGNINWGTILTLLGIVWIAIPSNTDVIDGGKGSRMTPQIDRLTKQNFPNYIVAHMVMGALVDALKPNPQIIQIAPPASDTPSVENPMLPFAPKIPTDGEGNFSIGTNSPCLENEDAETCWNRLAQDSSNPASHEINRLIQANIEKYNEQQEKFNQDLKQCKNEATTVAPLDDYLLTYDLQVYCMVNKGYHETLNKLSEKSSLLKNRLGDLDKNKKTLNSYLNY